MSANMWQICKLVERRATENDHRQCEAEKLLQSKWIKYEFQIKMSSHRLCPFNAKRQKNSLGHSMALDQFIHIPFDPFAFEISYSKCGVCVWVTKREWERLQLTKFYFYFWKNEKRIWFNRFRISQSLVYINFYTFAVDSQLVLAMLVFWFFIDGARELRKSIELKFHKQHKYIPLLHILTHTFTFNAHTHAPAYKNPMEKKIRIIFCLPSESVARYFRLSLFDWKQVEYRKRKRKKEEKKRRPIYNNNSNRNIIALRSQQQYVADTQT